MLLRLAAAVGLLAGSLPAVDRSALRDYFAEHEGVWYGRGGGVQVEAGAVGIRLNGFRLEHQGCRNVTPVPEDAGTLRRLSGRGLQQGRLASSLLFPGVCRGVDLRLKLVGARVKTEYLLSPGIDPSKLRFRLAGSGTPRLEEGELVAGSVRQEQPVSWQIKGVKKLTTQVRYRLLRRGWIRFDARGLDPSLPLVIDPWLIASGRVLGGKGIEIVTALAHGAGGELYAAGYSDSPDLISSPVRARSSGVEAFVLRLNPATHQVIWATWIGGSGDDRALAITVDASGHVWTGGATSSFDFPYLGGTQLYGSSDGFLVRLTSSGSVAFSTCLGGVAQDSISGLAAAPSGAVWAVGETFSVDFPVRNALQKTRNGASDAFAAQFSASGTLQFSTFWGGSKMDSARAVATDSAGNVYFTGTTASSDFPVFSALQPNAPGAPDAFIVKLNAGGNAIVYSTYLGGSPREVSLPESGNAIVVSAEGAAWVAGTTSSFNFPQIGSLQSGFGGGATDAFLVRVAPDGSALQFSTLFGGASSDEGQAVALHPSGRVALAGSSASPDLPQRDPILTCSVGAWHGFFTSIGEVSGKLHMSTCIGGNGSDTVLAIAASSSGYQLGGASTNKWLAAGEPGDALDGFVALVRDLPTSVSITASGAAQWTVSGEGCQPGMQTGPKNLQWLSGSVCSVSTPAVLTTAESRVRFDRWTDGSTQNPRTFTAAGFELSAGLVHTAEYTLTASVQPAGAGTIQISPAAAANWYPAGTSLALTAQPAPGWRMGAWSGAVAGTSERTSLVLDSPATVTATFDCAPAPAQAALSVSSGGAEISVWVNAGAGCSWVANSLAPWITLTAGAFGTGPGSLRLAVSENTGTAVRAATILVAGTVLTVTQAGLSSVSVSVSLQPAGMPWTVSGAGCSPGTYSGAQTLQWLMGTACTIRMDVHTLGGLRYVFSGWSDGTSTNPRTLTPQSNIALTANYRTEYQLAVIQSGGGSIACNPAGGWQVAGSEVACTATPAAGQRFAGWNGTAFGRMNPIRLPVSGPMFLWGSMVCPKCSLPGVWRKGGWYLDNNGSHGWDGGDRGFGWGSSTSTPVLGDWDGDGRTEIGAFDKGAWFLDADGDYRFNPPTDHVFQWGSPNGVPVVGDWNGDGRQKVGVFENGVWILDTNGNRRLDLPGDQIFAWGGEGVTPVVGDWNGDGRDKAAIYVQGLWFLDYDGDGRWTEGVDRKFHWGTATATPLAGDWTGRGRHAVGVFDRGLWFLDADGNGRFEPGDLFFHWGSANSVPLTGDWSGSGRAQVGVFDSGFWFLDRNGDFKWDMQNDGFFQFGLPGDTPLYGKW